MRIRHITKTYNGKKVLDFNDMEIQKGIIYAVVGANGSGKSTLARILSGIEQPDSQTAFDGEYAIGYMPQHSYAFRMSVMNNILLNGTDPDKAEHLLKTIKMDKLSQSNAKNLSGGETSRMALARIMMKPYDVLILDEPCASMDMESTLLAEEMIRMYKTVNDSAVLLITHSISQAKRCADEIIFMSDGCNVESGKTDEILNYPKNENTRKFLEFFSA